jgi:hypothetical protein
MAQQVVITVEVEFLCEMEDRFCVAITLSDGGHIFEVVISEVYL